MNLSNSHLAPFRALIVGGGVAALEAALALRELAGERVAVTLLAPAPEFIDRPMRVREPFACAAAHRYPLDEIARDLGAELIANGFAWLDAPARQVHTENGRTLEYDALLLAMGARPRAAFAHGLTIDDRILDEQLHGLVCDVEGGYVGSIAFVAPPAPSWPLPIYELALMTAARAYDMWSGVAITVVTPEDAPLAAFGRTASDAVTRLLEDTGITVIPSAQAGVPANGRVTIEPGGRMLPVDRVVALPRLYGPSAPGVPRRGAGGFIPIDAQCRVRRLPDVFAAGDATDFPIKHGAVAAQQADAAAAAIAALAGAPIKPRPFDPELRALLLGGDQPLYVSARVVGGRESRCQISAQPLWSPPSKIAARYLAPYLASRDRALDRRPAPRRARSAGSSRSRPPLGGAAPQAA